MKFKTPNYLTIGRIIIVPIFVFAFYLPGFYGDLIPFVLFVVASFTDFLDGLLARMFKEESKLGELLDPIADKIIVATALILLVMDGTIKNYEVIAAITSKFLIVPSITSNINAVATIILSAIGSNNSPSLDSSLNILANNPSKKSVNEAITNSAKGITSP